MVAANATYLERIALRLVLLTQVVGQRGGLGGLRRRRTAAGKSRHRGFGCSPKGSTPFYESVVNLGWTQEGCRCAGGEGEGEGAAPLHSTMQDQELLSAADAEVPRGGRRVVVTNGMLRPNGTFGVRVTEKVLS